MRTISTSFGAPGGDLEPMAGWQRVRERLMLSDDRSMNHRATNECATNAACQIYGMGRPSQVLRHPDITNPLPPSDGR